MKIDKSLLLALHGLGSAQALDLLGQVVALGLGLEWPGDYSRPWTTRANWQHYLGILGPIRWRFRVSISWRTMQSSSSLDRACPMDLTKSTKAFECPNPPVDLYLHSRFLIASISKLKSHISNSTYSHFFFFFYTTTIPNLPLFHKVISNNANISNKH